MEVFATSRSPFRITDKRGHCGGDFDHRIWEGALSPRCKRRASFPSCAVSDWWLRAQWEPIICQRPVIPLSPISTGLDAAIPAHCNRHITRRGASSAFDHRCCLNLNQCLIFDQARDHHHCHRGEMAAQHFAIGLANFALPREIFAFVRDVPCQAGDIRNGAAGLFDDIDDVAPGPVPSDR